MQRAAAGTCNSPASPWTTQVRRSDGSTLGGTAPADVAMGPPTILIFDGNGQLPANPPALVAGIFTLTVDRVSGIVTVQP